MAQQSKEQAGRLGSVARKLVYLSGGKFKTNVSVYDLAIPVAHKALGVVRHNGSAKSFIIQNLDQLEEYVKLHSAEVQRLKKNRPVRKSIAEPKPWKKDVIVGGVDVTTPQFLETYEWRKLRMEALKKYGPKCMCCGATPATGAVMNVDHIKPRKLFPSLAMSLDNLQILCHDCNHGKGNWDRTDWRKSK
jgi:hypothetical protein